MNCRMYFTSPFLDQHFTKSWRSTSYKKHRESVLLDREKSLLPYSQDEVQKERRKRELIKNRSELFREMKEAKAILRNITERYNECMYDLKVFDSGEKCGHKIPFSFVAACPSQECRGFLDDMYSCGTCTSRFCKNCHEKIEDESHSCDPSIVASVKAVLKDSRSCPGCGVAISKVSGCDQMYCTLCDTAFSYQNGEKIFGVIHNPHYFELLKKREASTSEKGSAEDLVRCGQWPPFSFLSYKARNSDFIRDLYQAARHVEQVELPLLPSLQRPLENLDLRVRYCLKDFEEGDFKKHLQARERKREFRLEVRGCLEVFVITALSAVEELLSGSLAAERTPSTYRPILEELVNAPLRAISERYKCSVPQLRLNCYNDDGNKIAISGHDGSPDRYWKLKRPYGATNLDLNHGMWAASAYNKGNKRKRSGESASTTI